MSEGIDTVQRRSLTEQHNINNPAQYRQKLKALGIKPNLAGDVIGHKDRQWESPLGRGKGGGLTGDFRRCWSYGDKLP